MMIVSFKEKFRTCVEIQKFLLVVRFDMRLFLKLMMRRCRSKIFITMSESTRVASSTFALSPEVANGSFEEIWSRPKLIFTMSKRATITPIAFTLKKRLTNFCFRKGRVLPTRNASHNLVFWRFGLSLNSSSE